MLNRLVLKRNCGNIIYRVAWPLDDMVGGYNLPFHPLYDIMF